MLLEDSRNEMLSRFKKSSYRAHRKTARYKLPSLTTQSAGRSCAFWPERSCLRPGG